MVQTKPGKRRRIYPSLIILACFIIGAMLGLFIGCSRSSADLELPTDAATIVYDAQKREVGRFFVQNREPISLTEMPQTLKEAIIAVEDARFYSHGGVDLRAIGRALFADLRGGGYRQGASTITQQLARTAFLNQRKKIARKISEAFYAIQLEHKYSKDQILEAYMNQIWFGRGVYGVQAAAKTYFGKEAKTLTLAESATLAAIIRRPGYYDPHLQPQATRERRDLVLNQMVKYGYLTETQALATKRLPLNVVPYKARERHAAYFLDYIERQLSDRFQRTELDTAGLRIYTTLDNDIQAAAEKAVAAWNASAKSTKDKLGVLQPQLSVVALDPSTGYITAMIGGRDFGNTQLNRAERAYRQPASAIKPFVYTAAIDTRRFTPTSILVDEQQVYPGPNGTLYKPRNFDAAFRGPITLQEALENSVNMIALQLVDQLGPSTVARYAKNMGLNDLVMSGKYNDLSLAPLALGGLTKGVTPLELAAAYSPLSNRGIHVEPIGLLKVTDKDGNVLLENRPHRQVVLSEATAYVITNMLRRVVANGTGRAAYIDEYHPVAGKTGTASDNTNAWFVGYTPNMLAAVWLGNDRQDQSLGFGSGEAARLWRSFMSQAVNYRPISSFVPPAGVTEEIPICRVSGQRFVEGRCPATDLDYAVYLADTPLADCHVHGGSPGIDTPTIPSDQAAGNSTSTPEREQIRVTVCAESGLLANAFCPKVEVKSYRQGEEPTQYCTIHGPK